MVNVRQGYACGGHGACYFATDPGTGLSLPAGCTCNTNYQGFFEFNWAYTTDCATLDGTSLSAAGTALRPTSGCIKKGSSTYPTTAYQSRCEDSCACSAAGTDLCINEPYRPNDQGVCVCKYNYATTLCDSCATGYYGQYCSVQCDPAVKCNGRGSCNSNGLCACNPGWGGAACDIKSCAFCNDNGQCDDDNPTVCNCFADYTGDTCEYRLSWLPSDWGLCNYQSSTKMCGDGTAERAINCQKTNYVRDYPAEDSGEVCPTVAVRPDTSIKCVHPNRPSCDCNFRTPDVTNGGTSLCETTLNGKSCGLQCADSYNALGSFTCLDGAFLQPYPECTPSASQTTYASIPTFKQSLAFQLKQNSNAALWETSMRASLPKILADETLVPISDISINSIDYTATSLRELTEEERASYSSELVDVELVSLGGEQVLEPRRDSHNLRRISILDSESGESEERLLQSYATAIPMVVSYQVIVRDASRLLPVQWRMQNVADSPATTIGTPLTSALSGFGIDVAADVQVSWSVSTPLQAVVYEPQAATTTPPATLSSSSTSTTTPSTTTAADDSGLSSTTVTLLIVGSIFIGVLLAAIIAVYLQRKKFERAKAYATKVEQERVQNLQLVHRKDGALVTHGSEQHLPNVPDREYADGTQYWGQMNALLMKHGIGVLKLKASTYRGSFENDEFSGLGIMSWQAGVVYAGEWKHNYMNGFGSLRVPKKYVYKGQFKKNERHGYGRCEWIDGQFFEGMWVNGKMHGPGKYGTMRVSAIWMWADGSMGQLLQKIPPGIGTPIQLVILPVPKRNTNELQTSYKQVMYILQRNHVHSEMAHRGRGVGGSTLALTDSARKYETHNHAEMEDDLLARDMLSPKAAASARHRSMSPKGLDQRNMEEGRFNNSNIKLAKGGRVLNPANLQSHAHSASPRSGRASHSGRGTFSDAYAEALAKADDESGMEITSSRKERKVHRMAVGTG